jgi:ankyrin repeat protein
MPLRDLPARPDLDHLKNEAKALRNAFLAGDAAAVVRVSGMLGPRRTLKLTEAQRVLAREYGFGTWAKLRAHVQAGPTLEDAVRVFLAAVHAQDRARANEVLRVAPRVADANLHVAAVLGLADNVRRLIGEDPSRVRQRAGDPPAEPLLYLCYSPYHGENSERDEGLLSSARALLDGGADPNTKDVRWGVPALYAVTGVRSVPRLAKLLLEAGASPNDGESVFHAAEHFHEDALELLLEAGADVNYVGDWGNTPLYFLLRYWDLERHARVKQGVQWLLGHGADPDVRCARERESSLHVAVRRGQSVATVALLLEHGADVNARRGDDRTAWLLARRGGLDEVATLLERHGATPSPLQPADLLIRACARGDVADARRLAAPDLVATLDDADLRLLPDAAAAGRSEVVRACLSASFPVDTLDESGATALHNAALRGRAAIARELLQAGADHRMHDPEHDGSPLGWACFGADIGFEPSGDYEGTVEALLQAGARLSATDHRPEHAGALEVLRRFMAAEPPG